MAFITERSLQRLQESIDLVDLISHYNISVVKVGSNYMAVCPFHDDKTPSMSISQEKGLYYCHACGATGNGITFVKEYEKLDFQEAVEQIARFFNVSLEYERNASFKKSDLLTSIALFYHNQIFKHQEILNYLYSRGITQDSIKKFEIGYSGANHETLNFIRENKLDYAEAIEYGILTETSNKTYAKFANRIIFPIRSSNGAIVGFGGRTLSNEKNIAKYLNSPQSKLFNKSRNLYGYYLAKQAIYEKKSMIICEGYLDVIMLHQAGFNNAVATLGTALNKEHLYLINKNNPRILMCYDGDNAGIKAALRASELLAQHTKDGGVILLKDGLDPADMIAQNRIQEFTAQTKQPKAFIEFVLEQIIANFNLKNPVEKAQALQSFLTFFHTLSPLLQEDYKFKCAARLGVNPSLISIKHNQKTQKETMAILLPSNNFAEESILMNMIAKKEHYYTALNFLDIKHFKTYPQEFAMILQGRVDDLRINEIKIKSNAKILDTQEFKEQIRIFLLQYANDLLRTIPLDMNLSGEEKMQKLKILQTHIKRIKQGELIAI